MRWSLANITLKPSGAASITRFLRTQTKTTIHYAPIHANKVRNDRPGLIGTRTVHPAPQTELARPFITAVQPSIFLAFVKAVGEMQTFTPEAARLGRRDLEAAVWAAVWAAAWAAMGGMGGMGGMM